MMVSAMMMMIGRNSEEHLVVLTFGFGTFTLSNVSQLGQSIKDSYHFEPNKHYHLKRKALERVPATAPVPLLNKTMKQVGGGNFGKIL